MAHLVNSSSVTLGTPASETTGAGRDYQVSNTIMAPGDTHTPHWASTAASHTHLFDQSKDSMTNNMTTSESILALDTKLSLNYELPSMIIVAVILFVVIVTTAFGNFLVGLALFKFRYLRTVSNFLIGNLALSDFLLATTILPLSTVNECLGHWVFGQVMCNFWLCADVLYCTASIWNLCVIAFDRFTATLYPVWYREKRSTKQAAIYISIVWVFSCAICVPPLLGWNDLSQNYIYDNTTDTYNCILFQTPSYVLYSAAGSFFIPFFITVFLYIRIFSVLRERMRKMRNSSRAYHIRKQQAQTLAAQQKQEKPLLTNSLNKPETEIEMSTTQTPVTNDGSGNTEELSSKSLFGSDSVEPSADEEDEDEDEDEEDSSTQIRSDHPLYVSSSEAESAALHHGTRLKNGVQHKVVQGEDCGAPNSSETIVILNPRHQHLSESDKEIVTSDVEHVRIVITHDDDDGTNTADPATQDQKTAKTVQIQKPESQICEQQQQHQQQTVAANRRQLKPQGPTLGSVLKSVNPFKGEKKRTRSTSQRHRYEQREMRATIRMAIIIAFFCGMWLGFFTTYVIGGFCTTCRIPRELDAFFFWLGYSNSCINPILYTIFNEEFRKAFQKILGCYKKRRPGNRR